MAEAEIKKPDYINFLLSRVIQDQLGFHVNVGTPDMEAERIGCLRWMLIARSPVMRTMLLESELKVGDEMDITDLKPNTFKDLLIYAYGHDHTESLGFTESIELLGAAEKYDVEDLKSRLSGLIAPKVSVDNVCTVLEHGPVCETAPQVWEKTTEVIQSKTEQVFEQPQFLTLSSTAVSHILQQDTLSVTEIHVWRAAVKWARFQVNSGAGTPNPDFMRKTVDPLLRHTRLCTIPHLGISTEVVPSGVLNKEELLEIFVSISTRNESSRLVDVCCSVKKRDMTVRFVLPVKSYAIGDSTRPRGNSRQSCFEMFVKELSVELVSVVINARPVPRLVALLRDSTYRCEGTVTITRWDAASGFRLEIPFSERVKYGGDVELKMQTPNGTRVVLEGHIKYLIKVDFDVKHPLFAVGTNRDVRDFELKFCSRCLFTTARLQHFKFLNYRVYN